MAHEAEADAIELWRIDLDRAAVAVADLWHALALRPIALAGPADGRRLTAHKALRLLLARQFGTDAAVVPFVTGTGGKPHLPSDPIEFNLSHSGPVALVALSRCGPIGIDVEALRPLPLAQARRQIIEAAAITVADGCDLDSGTSYEALSLQAWVRLESVAKASGEGIGTLLQRLDVRPGRPAPSIVTEGRNATAVALDLEAGAGFVAAAASFRNCLPALRAAKLRTLPETAADLAVLIGRPTP